MGKYDLQKSRAYYAAHKEHIDSYRKSYGVSNRKKLKRYRRAYYLAHQKEFQEAAREHHKLHALERAEDRKRRRAVYLLREYRGTDREHGWSNDLTAEWINNALLLNRLCVYCGFPSSGADRLDNSIGHE